MKTTVDGWVDTAFDLYHGLGEITYKKLVPHVSPLSPVYGDTICHLDLILGCIRCTLCCVKFFMHFQV